MNPGSLHPGLTTAQTGWRVVQWPYSLERPTGATFHPIVAWGTALVEEAAGAGGEATAPVAVYLEDAATLAWEDGNGENFLGFSPPGQDEREWAAAAITAWEEWQGQTR